MLFVLAGCSLGQMTIDWIDIVMWDGSKYEGNYSAEDSGQRWKTGAELGEVSFKMDGKAGMHYKMKNGDAAYLSPGTKIFEMAGYDPAFRIIADGRVYEVNEPGEADTLGDFIDIEGKVDTIIFLKYEDDSKLGQLSGHGAEQFVQELLVLEYQSYYDVEKDIKGNPVFIEIALNDGTTTKTAYFPASNFIRYGAFVSDQLQEIIDRVLSDLDM